MRVENWLRESESLVLPAWMRKVRSRGGLDKSNISTEELKHHVFIIFYDRMCKAVASGDSTDMDEMLHKLVSDHIRQEYTIDQVVQLALQLKSVVWQFLFQSFSAHEAQTMADQAEPMLDRAINIIVETYTELTRASLNERLEEFNFLTQRLAAASEEADSLYAISRTLNSTLDIQQTLEAIADNLTSLASIDFCVIWRLGANSTLYVGTAKGDFDAAIVDVVLPLDPPTSFVTRSLSMQRRQVLDQPDDALLPFLHRRDVVAMPMFNENRPIGVIMTNIRHEGKPLDPSVISLIQAASEQSAVALENAQLYDQVRRFNQELEQMVYQRTQELEKANIELERVNRDLERLDRTKSDFISIAAHELKTPLTLIQGYTNIMRDDPAIKQNPFLANLLQGLLKGSQRLYDIIESMIDVSMIDTQVLQLRPSQISLSNMIHTLRVQYAEPLQERQLTLTLGDFKNVPYIEADAKRLYQVFENLLVNAIKYTPDGGMVDIDGWMLDVVDQDQWVEVVVADSGIGIDQEDHERIFEKFYQTGELALHSTGKTKFKGGGPGLGLTIAKGIVTAHGGRIWVESPGHDDDRCPGSVFHVVLPVKSKIKLTHIVSPFSYDRDRAAD